MSECVCSDCRNLKGNINEDGIMEEYECEYGFPSPECEECEEEGCELDCPHYMPDDECPQPKDVVCEGCGKVLKQVCHDEEKGRIYCIDCFMNKESE